MTTVAEQAAPIATRDGAPGQDTGRLAMSCPDGPGVIARVASFLLARGANIVQSDQYPTGPAGGRFFLRIEFYLPGLQDSLADLERDFASDVAAGLDARFRLRDATAPARVAIFVSRYDHCMLDLAWRVRRGELPIEIIQVISNHPDLRADVTALGLPFEHIPVTRRPGRRPSAASSTCCAAGPT